MKIKLDEGAIMPTKAHKSDAGFDLYTPKSFILSAGSSCTVDTGVHIELPEGTVGFLKSKSGLNVNRNVLSGEGVIDAGYTGSIVVKLRYFGDKTQIFNAGDKISQLVILPIYIPQNLEVVTELAETERGDNGFGSSGR